jgi:NAD(P)-dependent dehydrogenase (short-subunit alcohol dehydrogenase family)
LKLQYSYLGNKNMKKTTEVQRGLNGQIGVVTGGAQGLGLAIVEQLARDGATVSMADVKLEPARISAARLQKQGLKVKPSHLDISDSTGVNTYFDRVVNEFGRLDILVNNAGVGQTIAPVVDLGDEEWDRVLSNTLTGTFFCCRAAAKIMERQESGCIVNVASINGQNPAAMAGAYNVAKAGVISLTKTLALELAAYGVRVNAVSPGPVYTQFNKTVMAQRCQRLNISEDEMIELIRKSIPLGRWGKPTDIASTVAFLCSSSASWITGEIFRVSGGLEGVSAASPKRAKS